MKLEQLHEQLQGVKKYHHLNWEELVRELKKSYNIRRIGGGAFGDVFYKDGWDYVIKVLDHDNAYLDFVNFIISHPNIHYPKIIKQPKKMTPFHLRNNNVLDKITILKIEKLNDPDNDIADFVANNIHRLSTAILNKNKNPIELYVENEHNVRMTYNEVLNNPKYKKFGLKGLFDAYIGLLDFNNGRHGIDIDSTGNILQRDDGTLVISDPFVDWDEVQANVDFREPHLSHVSMFGGAVSGPTPKNIAQQLVMSFT